MTNTTIVWIRQDFRTIDHQALSEGAKRGLVVPLYIHDEQYEGSHQRGAASKWWLHHALKDFKKQLEDLGATLIVRKGNIKEELQKVIQKTGADALYFHRRYEPDILKNDVKLVKELKTEHFTVETFESHLLLPPWENLNKSGEPYKVYTPYYKSFRKRPVPAPVKKLSSLSIPAVSLDSIEIEELELTPTVRWDQTIQETWNPTEQGAHHVLERFLKKRILNYDNGRDFPGNRYVSELSPYLAFGQVSVRTLYHYLLRKMDETQNNKFPEQAESFIKQLIWREFSYHILYHFPHSIQEPLNERFKKFAWEKSENYYRAWKQGKTGYPLVDAGMRELWATGYMHNRVRMIVGSFLVKHLLIHWKDGEKWFWDTLVDADLANNTFGWQWAGGSGADAAPYFRIFNPTLQSERFDKEGDYVKKWIPELKHLPKRYLHKPWEASAEVLKEACIELGKDYPHPIVNHKEARERALQRYEAVKFS